MKSRMATPMALMALCLSSSVYCFADEPTCSYGKDGKPDTCSFESGDLYEVSFFLLHRPHFCGRC